MYSSDSLSPSYQAQEHFITIQKTSCSEVTNIIKLIVGEVAAIIYLIQQIGNKPPCHSRVCVYACVCVCVCVCVVLVLVLM